MQGDTPKGPTFYIINRQKVVRNIFVAVFLALKSVVLDAYPKDIDFEKIKKSPNRGALHLN